MIRMALLFVSFVAAAVLCICLMAMLLGLTRMGRVVEERRMICLRNWLRQGNRRGTRLHRWLAVSPSWRRVK